MKTSYNSFEKISQSLRISCYPSWKFYNWVLYPSHSIYTSGGLWAPAMLLKNSPFTHFWCNNLAQFKVQFLVETVKQHATGSPWNHKDDLICLEFSWNSQKIFLKYIISSNVDFLFISDECHLKRMQNLTRKMLKNLRICYWKKYLIFVFHSSTIWSSLLKYNTQNAYFFKI